MAVELFSGDRKRKGGAGFEGERESEGVWGRAGAEELNVDAECIVEERFVC